MWNGALSALHPDRRPDVVSRRTDGASRSTTRSSSAADVRSSGSRSSETGGWSRKCCERTRKEARPLDAQGEWGPDDPTPGSHQGRRR